ncbi:MAG: tetratricopeptide repeat protein [Bacteroidota bacterium]|nr:tetratricopeptide repeat protein [Bacteroidota bacterium]
MQLNKRTGSNMRGRLMLVCLFSAFSMLAFPQGDKKFIRQGNREYEKQKYSESEISYRKAIDKNKLSTDAVFNVGDALYKQKKYEDAGKQFADNTSMNEKKVKKSTALYNLGNSFLMANKFQESIEAYKNSLMLNPGNMEAKYNLAYAQDLLKKQQQQQQQKQDQDKNKQNKDEKKNNEENKNQDNKQQQQNNNQDQNKQNQQDQQQQQNISKEDADRLLKALANDEEKVQEKVRLEKAAREKVRTLKNW